MLQALDRALFGGSPDEVPELYRERNPLTYVDAVEAPLLILAGENDSRCPIRQVWNYVGPAPRARHRAARLHLRAPATPRSTSRSGSGRRRSCSTTSPRPSRARRGCRARRAPRGGGLRRVGAQRADPDCRAAGVAGSRYGSGRGTVRQRSRGRGPPLQDAGTDDARSDAARAWCAVAASRRPGLADRGTAIAADDRTSSIAGLRVRPGGDDQASGDTVTWTNNDQAPHDADRVGLDDRARSRAARQRLGARSRRPGRSPTCARSTRRWTGTVVVQAAGGGGGTAGGGDAAADAAADGHRDRDGRARRRADRPVGAAAALALLALAAARPARAWPRRRAPRGAAPDWRSPGLAPGAVPGRRRQLRPALDQEVDEPVADLDQVLRAPERASRTGSARGSRRGRA